MAKKKTCKDCGTPLENDICPDCGWSEEEGSKEGDSEEGVNEDEEEEKDEEEF